MNKAFLAASVLGLLSSGIAASAMAGDVVTSENQVAVKYGDLVMDLDAHRVTVRGSEVHLSPREFALLRRLLESPRLVGEILTVLDPLPLRMFCLGSSDINLCLVVSEAHAADAVRRLHARFLEGAR